MVCLCFNSSFLVQFGPGEASLLSGQTSSPEINLFICLFLFFRTFLQSSLYFGYRVNPTGLSWATSLTASPWRWTREEEEERHLQLTQTPRHGRTKAKNLRMRTRGQKMEDKWLNEQSLSGRTAALRPDPLRPNLDSERRVRTGRTATGTFTSLLRMTGSLFQVLPEGFYFDVAHFPTKIKWSALELMNMKRAKNWIRSKSFSEQLPPVRDWCSLLFQRLSSSSLRWKITSFQNHES